MMNHMGTQHAIRGADGGSMFDLRSQIEHRTSHIRFGFTLVEILFVVLILGIVAALVVPQVGSSATFEVQGAARTVVADLLFAQNDAIANQTTRKVVFDTVNNRYRVTDNAGNTLSAPWLGGTYQVPFGTGSRFPAAALGTVSFTNTTISFDELGAPSSGGTIDITAGTQRYRVTVTAITGRISVTPVTGG